MDVERQRFGRQHDDDGNVVTARGHVKANHAVSLPQCIVCPPPPPRVPWAFMRNKCSLPSSPTLLASLLDVNVNPVSSSTAEKKYAEPKGEGTDMFVSPQTPS